MAFNNMVTLEFHKYPFTLALTMEGNLKSKSKAFEYMRGRDSLQIVFALQSSWWVKSSQSEKSSWYDRKTASGAHHTKCVHHIGCSSEAAPGNVVKFFKVHASRSSWLVKSSQSAKSSQYSRERVSLACYM